jgi:lipopolysaccharide export system protein LptC
MAARAETADQRLAIYRKLGAHNRLITLLRFGVPALGVAVFLILASQIYLASIGKEFGIAGLTIDRTMATLQAPRYAGVMADGTTYNVKAGEARAALSATNVIDLTNASIVFSNPGTKQTTATAKQATLDTVSQQVQIDAITDVTSSDGTIGRFTNTRIDWAAQMLNSVGGAHLEFADGTKLDADTATYDMEKAVWIFSRVTVTMPSTPGETDATTSWMEKTP